MTYFLKQSTAVKVTVGPLVEKLATDLSNDASVATAFVASDTDLMGLIKANATAIVDTSNLPFTAISQGMYHHALGASDVSACGPLVLAIVDESAIRAYRQEFMVVPANVYDSMFSTGDYLDVNVVQIAANPASAYVNGTTRVRADVEMISGDSDAADNLEAAMESVVVGTVGSGSTTTKVVSSSITESTNDHYNGRLIVFRTGALAGQAASITDFSGASKEFTVSALTEAPTSGDLFVIV